MEVPGPMGPKSRVSYGPMGPKGRRPYHPRQLWGSFFPFLGGKIRQKLKKRKFKKPYIKVVWDSCLWDSGRWDGWGIILGWIPPLFRDIWSHKTSGTLFCLLFSQYCVCYFLNIVSNPNRRSPSKNQFRDYHAWNRIEKSMPQHCTNFSHF